MRHWRGIAIAAALTIWLGTVPAGFSLAPMPVAASPAAMAHLPVESAPADDESDHAVSPFCEASAVCCAILPPTGQMEVRQQTDSGAASTLWVSFGMRRPDPPPPRARAWSFAKSMNSTNRA
ncbi:MAG: hypothetical protein CVT73_04305 [Alphaproteobacteria bacterium HGW-Alphaproteobacteria-12]|nr:MAG: hypothetical protein CVT73_04305 [Alphaproteobacteria bacterium HGW-Alphaproteobacteria-12]